MRRILTACVDGNGGTGLARLVAPVVPDYPELIRCTTWRRRP